MTMKSIAFVAVFATLVTGCLFEDADAPETTDEALVGPFRPFKSARSTRAAANLQDPEGTLSDTDFIEAPDSGPFSADGSAFVGRGEITAAGVTTHDSSLDGRALVFDSHCDANANVLDPETENGFASCGNDYEVGFELLRPAKVTLDGAVASFRAGFAGGWGEIWLRDATGEPIVGIASDNESIYESLILNPGTYKLIATAGGSASAFYDQQFSAVTIDVRVTLTARNR
jgi:hypothetical protein